LINGLVFYGAIILRDFSIIFQKIYQSIVDEKEKIWQNKHNISEKEKIERREE
jgi:hypothetical protein